MRPSLPARSSLRRSSAAIRPRPPRASPYPARASGRRMAMVSAADAAVVADLGISPSAPSSSSSSAPTPRHLPPRMGMAAEQRPADAAIISNPLEQDELLELILMRLPGVASLARAVAVSDRWCRVISDERFLRLFREQHPSSSLFGVYLDTKKESFPCFYLPSHNPDRDISSAIRRADLCLSRVPEDDRPWRIRDCRNGRLLLDGDQGVMCIYDPLSKRRVPIGARTDLDRGCRCLADCLLDDGLARHTVPVEQHGEQLQAQESFRVISLQFQSRSRFSIRAVEYNSGTLEWRVAHPQTGWTNFQFEELKPNPMYAAGHIFWQTDDRMLLVLDTSTMEFSEHALPEEIDPTSWAIGELEDGKGCLVCLRSLESLFREDDIALEVWSLGKEKEGKEKQATFYWKLEKDARVSEMLPEDPRVDRVRKVINGLALIDCTKARGTYTIELQSMTLLAKFECGKDIYPYQMSWPPAVLADATRVVSRHTAANLSNEESATVPSKNMDIARESATVPSKNMDIARGGTSSGGSESASLQSQLHVESPHVSGYSDTEDALVSLGIGDADATIVSAINAVNSHANGTTGRHTYIWKKNLFAEEETGGWPSDGRTMLPTIHEEVAPEEETGGWPSDGRTMLPTIHEEASQEVHSCQTPLNSEQHGIGEKSSQDLHGGSAPMETDPCHDELTLQTAAVFPSESCDGNILEDKSETDNLSKNTTEDTEMLEEQNSDKARIEVSKEVHEKKKRLAQRLFTGCSEELSSKHKKKIHEGSSAHIKISTDRMKCACTPPAGGPEAHEETRPAQVGASRTSNRARKPSKLVIGDEWVSFLDSSYNSVKGKIIKASKAGRFSTEEIIKGKMPSSAVPSRTKKQMPPTAPWPKPKPGHVALSVDGCRSYHLFCLPGDLSLQ